jgi:type III pantothenate kinase
MSQSNLFVDIGHSAVKWRTLDSEVFSQGVEKFSEKSLPDSQSVWLSAVAHPHIVETINMKFSDVEVVKPLSHFGSLTIAYKEPLDLGSDRFLAMLGALKHFPDRNMLIIDVGSALTIDVVNNSGEHQGGLIMPGLQALRGSFAKFATNTKSLNSSNLQSSTDKAWLSGTQKMLISSIKEQITGFESEYFDGKVILTGGSVRDFISELPETVNYFDNLVLDGLESYSKSMG